HWAGNDCRTEGCLPEQRAAASIQSIEVALASPAEKQIRSRGQDACLGNVGHLEFPFPFTGLRVERSDRAVALFLFPEIRSRRPIKWNGRSGCSPGIVPAFVILARKFDKYRRGVNPCGNVEKPRPRTVRGGIPASPAGIAGIHQGIIEAGSLALYARGFAPSIESTGPCDLNEWFS